MGDLATMLFLQTLLSQPRPPPPDDSQAHPPPVDQGAVKKIHISFVYIFTSISSFCPIFWPFMIEILSQNV